MLLGSVLCLLLSLITCKSLARIIYSSKAVFLMIPFLIDAGTHTGVYSEMMTHPQDQYKNYSNMGLENYTNSDFETQNYHEVVNRIVTPLEEFVSLIFVHDIYAGVTKMQARNGGIKPCKSQSPADNSMNILADKACYKYYAVCPMPCRKLLSHS